jgi:hypothetical protein
MNNEKLISLGIYQRCVWSIPSKIGVSHPHNNSTTHSFVFQSKKKLALLGKEGSDNHSSPEIMKRSFIFTIALRKPNYIIVLISNITNQLIKEKVPIQKGKGEEHKERTKVQS